MGNNMPEKSWILRKGGETAHGMCPTGFPLSPWVLYSPDEPTRLYLSKSNQVSPPTEQWYSYQPAYPNCKPLAEPKITLEIVGERQVRVNDNREFCNGQIKRLPTHNEDLCLTNSRDAIAIQKQFFGNFMKVDSSDFELWQSDE